MALVVTPPREMAVEAAVDSAVAAALSVEIVAVATMPIVGAETEEAVTIVDRTTTAWQIVRARPAQPTTLRPSVPTATELPARPGFLF